jgi:hypothetical protein
MDVDSVFTEDGPETEWVNVFFPDYFSDAPAIITISTRLPPSISQHIRRSFKLFWSDAPSCANAIRTSIEELLTAHRVVKTAKKSKTSSARRHLSLHSRIELFKARKPQLADKLFAIKWIGNAGSHIDSVERDDLLDAYEILQYVIEELYVNPHTRIGALAREINRKKAPRSRKRGSKR